MLWVRDVATVERDREPGMVPEVFRLGFDTPGAGTSLWATEFGQLYVAAPATEKQTAAVLVFEPQK